MMRKAKGLSGYILIMILGFCLLSIPAFCRAEEKAVTVMIYLTGSDLESGQGAATADILEIMNSGFDTDQVSVVAFVGGSTKWYSGFSTDQCGIYSIDPHRGAVRLCELDLMNMGSPETLTYFLDWCAANCPSKRYDLILWDHGGGPLYGLCADRLFGGDSLTLDELSSALSDSPFHAAKQIELVGCDACLMGSLELATVLSSYAKYLVVSEEVEPAEGWNYSYLKEIAQDISGADTGKRIVDDYFSANEKAIGQKAHVTMTCLDLSGVPDLNDKIDNLFDNLSGTLNTDTFSEISRIRESCSGVGRMIGQEYDLVDLKDLLLRLDSSSSDYAEDALDTFSKTIVYHRSTTDRSGGLSIYFPYYNKNAYLAAWNQHYETIESSGAYGEYIRRFGAYHTHASFGHWNNLITQAEGTEDGTHHFSMQLTEEQVKYYGAASLIIVEKLSDQEKYSRIYEVSDVHLDENGVLHAAYDDAGFYPVDDNGDYLSDSVPFYRADDMYLINCMLERGSDLGETEAAMIACVFDREADCFRIIGAYSVDENGMITVQTLQDWRYVVLWRNAYPFQQDADGQFLSWGQNQQDISLFGYELEASDLAGFVLKRGVPSASKRLAFFQVSDTQHYSYGSQPVEIAAAGRVETSSAVQTLLDDDDFTIQLSAVDIAPSAVKGAGVILGFETIRKSNKTADALYIQHLIVNGIVIPDYSFVQLIDQEKETNYCEVLLDFYTLQMYGISQIQQISIDIFSERFYMSEWNPYAVLTAPLALDLSEYYAPFILENPIAVSSHDGITLELYDFFFSEQDLSLQCLMKMKNENALLFNNGSSSYLECYVNGSLFSDVTRLEYSLRQSSMSDLYCPPGTETSFYVVFDGKTSSYTLDSCDNYYQLYGISQIEQLGFRFRFWEEEKDLRFTFHLPEPISVLSTEPDTKPVLLDCQGLSVYLEKMEPYEYSFGEKEQGVKLLLVIENHSDDQCDSLYLGDDAVLGDSRVRVNGNTHGITFLITSFDPLPQGESRRIPITFTGRTRNGVYSSVFPFESVSSPFSVQLGDQHIRTTPVSITLSEPITGIDQTVDIGKAEIEPAQVLNAQAP